MISTEDGHRIELISGRQTIVKPFLNRVYGTDGVDNLILVSPWMKHLEFLTGDTYRLIERLQVQSSRLTVITREPEEGWHSEFLETCARLRYAEIYYVSDLHAKYYVCNAARGSFALIGSPNLYEFSRRTFEIGVVIHARGPGQTLISDLEDITVELKTSQNKKIMKRIGG